MHAHTQMEKRNLWSQRTHADRKWEMQSAATGQIHIQWNATCGAYERQCSCKALFLECDIINSHRQNNEFTATLKEVNHFASETDEHHNKDSTDLNRNHNSNLLFLDCNSLIFYREHVITRTVKQGCCVAADLLIDT